MHKKTKKKIDDINTWLKNNDKSVYWLSKNTGINESSLSRYLKFEMKMPLNVYVIITEFLKKTK